MRQTARARRWWKRPPEFSGTARAGAALRSQVTAADGGQIGEIDRFARIRAGREGRQSGKVPSRREPDQADPLGALVPQAENLDPQSIHWFGVTNHQRVAEHAGSETQPIQPADDRRGLVGHMLRVAPTGQDDHVRSDGAQRDLAVLWASIQDRVSSR